MTRRTETLSSGHNKSERPKRNNGKQVNNKAYTRACDCVCAHAVVIVVCIALSQPERVSARGALTHSHRHTHAGLDVGACSGVHAGQCCQLLSSEYRKKCWNSKKSGQKYIKINEYIII